MKCWIATVAVSCLLAASTASAEVTVSMHDGRVSIVAKDATLRQIMTEWARVGQTKIVNLDRIPGGPLTLELRDVTEDQALDVLMRPLSGYLAAPRAEAMANLSKFDRILVMPTVAAARATTVATSAPATPMFQPPAQTAVFPQSQPGEQPEAAEPVGAEMPPGARPPVFTGFPQPQVVNPNAAPQGNFVVPAGMVPNGAMPPQSTAPTAVPTAPFGVAVPGMTVPAPAAAPGLGPGPPLPVRRPGGL